MPSSSSIDAPVLTKLLDRQDTQGLLASGFSSLPVARYILLQITQPDQAKRWLRRLLTDITPAAERSDTFCLNIAFTHSGFVQMKVPKTTLNGFSREFQEGMTVSYRSRLLGDCDLNDPVHWRWGGPNTGRVDVLLMVYAHSTDELTQQLARYEATMDGLIVLHRLDAPHISAARKEHFGFNDGISQPIVPELSPARPTDKISNTVALGEFVLGYPNQYTKLPDSPEWPSAEQKPLNFGENGTYMVFRQLEQNVVSFWKSVRQSALKQHGSSDAETCLRVAAKWVGRWPGGAPTTLSPTLDDPALANATDFRYAAGDALGDRCPLGAHIRRANPRDALGADPELSLDVANKHRLLRRGRPYGPPAVPSMEPVDILAHLDKLPDAERGLYFIALNANISRQFEFVQHTWLQNSKFAGLYDDADPITGHAPFTIPGQPFALRTDPLPLFITVRGGAYFFMPGLRALRLMTNE